MPAPRAPIAPRPGARRSSTEPGVSCHTCRCLGLYTVGDTEALCGHPHRGGEHTSFWLESPGEQVCDLHVFGRGWGDSTATLRAVAVAFADARGRLLELLVDPQLSEERRAEILEWLTRPIPEAT